MTFPAGSPDMDEFARTMADAGMEMYRAETLLDGFIRSVFGEHGLEFLDLEVEFRCFEGQEAPATRFEKIQWDDAASSVVLLVEGGSPVPWEGVTLGAKSMIADQVHLKLLSSDLYKNLRNQ